MVVNQKSSLNCRFCCILALSAISVFAARVRAETAASNSAPEQEIRAAETQLATALSSVDVDALSRLWADDFVSTMADGRVTTGRKRLEALRRQKRDPNSQVTNENQQV